MPSSLSAALGALTVSLTVCLTATNSASGQNITFQGGKLVAATTLQPATPAQPQQPVQPVQPEQPTIEPAALAMNLWGGGLGLESLGTPAQQAPLVGGGQAAGVGVVTFEEGVVRNTNDVGDMLQKSISLTNVYSWQRNPLMNDIKIRGYRYEQIRTTANGALWQPVRPDLDTPLAHIDSSFVNDVVVLKGPYSVRLGPGFAFVDVQLKDTQRSQTGTIWGGRTAASFNTNGNQFMGSQSFYQAGANSGAFVGYTQRLGSDYSVGGNASQGGDFKIDSNYSARSAFVAYGLDLGVDNKIEFNYMREDLTGIDLPSQVNDLTFAHSDAFSGKYSSVDQEYYDSLVVNSWFNQSKMAGNDNNKAFNPFSPAPSLQPTGFFNPYTMSTQGSNYSTGTRAAMTWGDAETAQLTIGTDATVTRQTYTALNTYYAVPYVPGSSPLGSFSSGVPRTSQEDGGLFADASNHITDRWKITIGGRFDYLNSNAVGTGSVGPNTLPPQDLSNNLTPPTYFGLPAFEPHQSYRLGAGYISSEYDLTDHWKVLSGFGFSQVGPSATQLYSNSNFLDIVQSGGVSAYFGNPSLKKQSTNQLDIGLKGNYDYVRCQVHGYYAYVNNFITPVFGPTATGSGINPPDYALFQNQNSILAGAEFQTDFDLTDQITPYATVAYQYGQDLVQHMPLWQIYPLVANLGFRLHNAGPETQWSLEWQTQVVGAQDRINTNVGYGALTPNANYNGEKPTPGFTISNLRAYYKLTRNVNLMGGVTNLGNRLYQTAYDTRINISQITPGGIYQPGRSFYALLEIKY